METKHESLKNEKHELFSQLKKVLHQEDETRRRAQLKEQRLAIFFSESQKKAVILNLINKKTLYDI